jgi:hypothetical protein
MFHKLRGQLTENAFESTDFHFYLILLSIMKLLIKAGPKLRVIRKKYSNNC